MIGRWRAGTIAVAVSLVVVLSGCSCLPEPVVTNLVAADDGSVWAELDTAGTHFDGAPRVEWWRSTDFGQTWVQSFVKPTAIDDVATQACDPSRPDVCYRSSTNQVRSRGIDQIDRTTDGGETWATAWRDTTDRAEFFDNCGGDAEFEDVIVVGEVDELSGIVLAAGYPVGVLRRSSGGDWDSVAVGSARSVSLTGLAFGPWLVTLVVAPFVGLVGWLLGWMFLFIRMRPWPAFGWSGVAVLGALVAFSAVFLTWSIGIITRWQPAWQWGMAFGLVVWIAALLALFLAKLARRQPIGAPGPSL